jgi:hypothetical protein
MNLIFASFIFFGTKSGVLQLLIPFSHLGDQTVLEQELKGTLNGLFKGLSSFNVNFLASNLWPVSKYQFFQIPLLGNMSWQDGISLLQNKLSVTDNCLLTQEKYE